MGGCETARGRHDRRVSRPDVLPDREDVLGHRIRRFALAWPRPALLSSLPTAGRRGHCHHRLRAPRRSSSPSRASALTIVGLAAVVPFRPQDTGAGRNSGTRITAALRGRQRTSLRHPARRALRPTPWLVSVSCPARARACALLSDRATQPRSTQRRTPMPRSHPPRRSSD